ncbi:MAG: pseudouridine-5'-phosphate glycosidase [Candidatus Riflebacteria bacterium]|nr:pseudouridine-5'-phosphate glycosidase [Candidatus Riflebacteria bacterium]
MLKHSLVINREVRDAITANQPVVALESTIISHGMPYPQNIETARLLEHTVRENGGIPATIAVLKGKIHVGLAPDELEFLATDKNVSKASRRDLPALLAGGRHAATTVAATMICAALAGVRFFATGGIGGVHRGGGESMDISADLREFAETPVLVVSAGAKAILDIPLTMEYLETMGIPVLGYCTDEMPAFYYAKSGVKVPIRVDSASEAAVIFKSSLELGYRSGILVGNPVPNADALDRKKIEACIAEAVADAQNRGIKGQQVTPFLLGRLNEITGGESLKTNIALVRNNAAVCAKIAVEFFK